MSARVPRFEIVHTDAGWHGRFRAANGKVLWWTETYERRRAAVQAVALLTGKAHKHYPSSGQEGTYAPLGNGCVEIRDVDERTTP